MIRRVRERVLGQQPFRFARPQVKPVLKEGKKYRALCRFSLEDNLIICIVARYLTDFCDTGFEPSSFAFRARTVDGEMPTHHGAFEQIYNLRTRDVTQDVFVAECDIRGFYDTVDHMVAVNSLQRVADQVHAIMLGRLLDPRAVEIFRAYLDCYSFPHDVLSVAEPLLKQRDPNRYFPWAEEQLGAYHTDPRTARIGVPQGGAISCIIANLVLDFADKRVAAVAGQTTSELHYFRYCDDMILLAHKRGDCVKAFQAYLETLQELKLPYHEPKNVWIYSKDTWDSKSKAPYCWTGKKWFGCVPWIQFGGYQIRYDGLVRIRKSSVNKQVTNLREATDTLKYGLIRANHPRRIPNNQEPPTIQASRSQVMTSFRQKLTAMGVGRVNLKHRVDGPLSMCWANGYQSLHGKPLVPGFLRRFDRERERQIHRLDRAAIFYGPGSRPRNPTRRPRAIPIGFPFSYSAQFNNTGGMNLIRNPYKPASIWGYCMEWLFTHVRDSYARFKTELPQLYKQLRLV